MNPSTLQERGEPADTKVTCTRSTHHHVLNTTKIVAAALCLFALPVAAQPALFSPSTSKTADLTPRQAEIFDILRTELGVEAVEIVQADVSVLTSAGVVELAFPGESFVLETVSAERRASGVVSWVGKTDASRPTAPGDVLVTLAARGGMVTGSVRRGGYLYEVRPLTGGLHAIARKSMAEYRIHGDGYEDVQEAASPATPPKNDNRPGSESQASGASLGASMATVVDVMFPYTTGVGAAFADPGALAQTFVDYANQVYANSAVDVELNLLYTYETPYASAGTQQDLFDVTDGPDFDVSSAGPYSATAGKMDEVHAFRDAYGADLVVLLSGTNTSGLCGIAWTNSFAALGFSANSASCGASTIVHEIGHNFGSQHDRLTDTDDTPGDGTNDPIYPYGRGYVNQAGDWATVMGYNVACDDDSTPGAPPFSAFCEIIPHLSNPNVTYTDTRAPIASGPTGEAATADNARVHQERRATISSFRTRSAPAQLAYSPGSASLALSPGGTSALTIELQNIAAAGATPLSYSAQLQGYSANSLTGATPEASKRRAGDCTAGQVLGQTSRTTFTDVSPTGTELGQSWTAPCSGTLQSISPANYPAGGTTNGNTWEATMRVYQGAGTSGTELTSEAITYTNPASGDEYVTFQLSTPVEIVEGETYTWFWDMTSGATSALFNTGDVQAGGTRYNSFGGGAVAAASGDMQYTMTFGAPDRWASVAPASGTIAPGASATVTVSVDATGLAAGTYTVDLVLGSNDPNATAVTIPITLYVDAPVAAETISGTAGWRLFAPAAPGLTVADLGGLNRLVGIPGYDEFNDPNDGGNSLPNLFTGFDGRDFIAASGGAEALEPGQGFWWYLYDANCTTDAECPGGAANPSYALPFTLATSNAPLTADVDVALHADNSKVNLLGNPFGQSLDLSTANTWAGKTNLLTPVFAIYNSGTNSYSYSTTTPIVSAWQGFYAYGKTAGTLTIPESARTTGGTLVKQDERVFLSLELSEATPLAPEAPLADRGAVLYFDEGASAGEDRFDLAELAPLDARHLTLAFGAESASGETELRGHEGRSAKDGAFEIPVHVGAAGSSEALVLTWPSLDRIPESWSVKITDLQTGAALNLRDAESYAFSVTPEAISPGSVSPGSVSPEAGLQAPRWAGTAMKAGSTTARFVLSIAPSVATGVTPEADGALSLSPPTPNPARGTARIAFTLATEGEATVSVYDVQGREVARLAQGPRASGVHAVTWNTSAVAAGVYVVRLQTADQVLTRRAVVVR